MDSSSPLAISPSSDQRFWSTLRSRVETLLDGRKRHADWSSTSTQYGAESRCVKRIKEDSLLLLRGMDSVASSLSRLKETLADASQGVENLVQPSLTDVLRSEGPKVEEEKITTETASCRSASDDSAETRRSTDEEHSRETAEKEDQKISKEHNTEAAQSETLKKAKNLAICVISKATALSRELKAVKSELGFMQERCDLLEEENRRLKHAGEKVPTQDEDDLVRLQVEALLAEKSKLANENATLTRENQRLQQLVDYQQLTALDLTETYDDLLHGVCLDFSDSEDDCRSEGHNQ